MPSSVPPAVCDGIIIFLSTKKCNKDLFNGLLARFIATRDPSTSKCLGFVDPYGDTVFNRLQIPVLIEELEAAVEQGCSPELHQRIASIIALARRALGEVHTYLEFVGD
jgi:hypothetical protein